MYSNSNKKSSKTSRRFVVALLSFASVFNSVPVHAALGADAAALMGYFSTPTALPWLNSSIKGMAETVSQTTMGMIQAQTSALMGTQFSIARSQNAAADLAKDRELVAAIEHVCDVTESSILKTSLTEGSGAQEGAARGYGAGAITGGTRGGGGGGVYGAGAKGSPGRFLSLVQGRDSSGKPAPTPDPETTQTIKASATCAFAEAGSALAAECAAAKLDSADSADYKKFPGADRRSITLFYGPQGSGTMTKRFTYAYPEGSAEHVAISSFKAALNPPLMLRDLRKSELATEEGRRYIGLRSEYDANMDVASWPENRISAARVPDKNLLEILKKRMESKVDGDFISTYLQASGNPKWKEDGISQDEYINLSIDARYRNKEFDKLLADHMAGGNVAGLVKEHIQVSVLQNILLWKLIQEQRENAVVNAQTTKLMLRMHMLPQLQAAHSTVTR